MRDNTSELRFNGAAYSASRDDVRLAGQMLRVWDTVSGGGWFTLPQLAEVTGDPPASISAQLRHLRKPRFGGHTVLREHIANGLYQYRVIPAGDLA